MLQDRPGYRPDIVDIVGHDWCRQPEAGEELLTAAEVKQSMMQKYQNIQQRSLASQEQYIGASYTNS